MKASKTQNEKENRGNIQDEESENKNENTFSSLGSSFEDEEVLLSILESLFFASHKPIGLHQIKKIFEDENKAIEISKIKKTIESLSKKYDLKESGVVLEEVSNGFQMRTRPSNSSYVKRLLKTKVFKLSNAALEVLSIVAYKQPCIKASVDELRGVESGHLLRTLMEKGLVQFLRKSDLPGRPMLYATTKKFLEVFNLKNLKELPSLYEMEELKDRGAKKNNFKESSQQNFDLFKDDGKSLKQPEKEEIQKRREKEARDERLLSEIGSKISNLRIKPGFLEEKNSSSSPYQSLSKEVEDETKKDSKF